MNKLIVKREGRIFVLRRIVNGQPIEVVKAMDSQMILDYVSGTWPAGTVVHWVIVPSNARVEEVAA